MHTKPLFFIHIAKTAGTTLWILAQRLYPRDQIVRIVLEQDKELHLREYLEGKKRDYQLIGGHFRFKPEYAADHCCFTMLRDPADRVLSAYYHVLRSPKHVLHTQMTQPGLSMEDGLRLLNHNEQVAILSGIPRTTGITREHLELAKRNIEQYIPLVGLTERFDESVMLYRHHFGWKFPYYRVRNAGKNREPNLPQPTIDFINDLNQLDVELYAFVQQRLDEQIRQLGFAFRRDLALFRATLPLWRRWDSRFGEPVKKSWASPEE